MSTANNSTNSTFLQRVTYAAIAGGFLILAAAVHRPTTAADLQVAQKEAEAETAGLTAKEAFNEMKNAKNGYGYSCDGSTYPQQF